MHCLHVAAWFVLDPVVPDSNKIMSNSKNCLQPLQLTPIRKFPKCESKYASLGAISNATFLYCDVWEVGHPSAAIFRGGSLG